jgi:ubiquinone/menaquinone biosynthesis C-methylase UbiE
MPGAAAMHTGQLTSLSVLTVCAGLSIGAWLLPMLSLWSIAQLLSLQVSLSSAGEVFAAGTLLGGLTGTPGGLGTSGSLMIVGLVNAGVSGAAASSAVFALRFGTQWFAVALGVVVAILWRKQFMSLLRTSSAVQQHFDALAPAYAADIPPFYRQQMLERKITAMQPMLPPANSAARGLDLGCGQGWYASELSQRGYEMHGIDLSTGQVAEAERYCQTQGSAVQLRTYDGVHLPYPDGHFDFVYSINVLHHVPSPDAQRDLMREVLRVLKRDGRFLLHEMNIENALFRAYVSYVFPLLKSIDEGTELWIRPSRLPQIPGGKWQKVMSYFTFVPEFLPERLLKLLRPVERMLESSRLRKYSAHYMATLTHDEPS